LTLLASLNRRSENVLVHPVIVVERRSDPPVMRPPTNTLLSQKTGVRTGYYQPASALLSLTNAILSGCLRSPHTPYALAGSPRASRAVPNSALAVWLAALALRFAHRSLDCRLSPKQFVPCKATFNQPTTLPSTLDPKRNSHCQPDSKNARSAMKYKIGVNGWGRERALCSISRMSAKICTRVDVAMACNASIWLRREIKRPARPASL
jgi:hypothetical protein